MHTCRFTLCPTTPGDPGVYKLDIISTLLGIIPLKRISSSCASYLENVTNCVACTKHNEAVPNKPQFVKNGRG